MNASVAIQVLPNVQDEEEVIRIVDEVIAYIRSTRSEEHTSELQSH